MCHSDESVPPISAGAGRLRSNEEMRLHAADGNTLMSYVALPEEPAASAGVVVMPDVRGLHQFYRELSIRLAEAGVNAVAIDYFGRTAKHDDRSESFEFKPHVQQMTPQSVATDVQTAAAFLRSQQGGAVDRVYTMGFCMGGGYSWRQSADTPLLAGNIGFYGRPSLAEDVTAEMQAPLLMLAAGADANIPVPEVEALAASARHQVPVDLVVYEGAPHSFFDRKYADHAAAAADAWARSLAFILEAD